MIKLMKINEKIIIKHIQSAHAKCLQNAIIEKYVPFMIKMIKK